MDFSKIRAIAHRNVFSKEDVIYENTGKTIYHAPVHYGVFRSESGDEWEISPNTFDILLKEGTIRVIE